MTTANPSLMSSTSPPSAGDNDSYMHNLAIKLSRALNTINPNDLLAQRVTDIAKANSTEGFIKGTYTSAVQLLPVFIFISSGSSIWQV